MLKSKTNKAINQIKKGANWLAKTNIFLYSIILVPIFFAVKGSIALFKDILKIPDIEFQERPINENFNVTIDLIFDTLILAPIVETLLFQALFFSIFKKFKMKRWIIVLISGIAFGTIHNYSLFYMIGTVPIGFIFMYMYILRAEMDNKPFASTMIAHSTINLIVIIITLITHFYKFGTWF